jgi:hypothetical protein
VITATTLQPWPISTTTSSFTAPSVIRSTVPLNWLRAE